VLCPTVASGKVVYITPIVNRLSDGLEVLELGAGGGRGDLYQTHELELPDKSTVEQLEKLFAERISDNATLFQARKSISEAFESKKSLSLGDYGLGEESGFSLNEVIEALKHGRQQSDLLWHSANQTGTEGDSRTALPRVIVCSTFSSYSLCPFCFI
jgi:DNA cross-link repair 1C protein